ncbi:hypothetical protein HMPREF3185_02150 [Porphyromonas somerae]|uniref:Uncharacterized protein n=1 Tax=Porphyromonas somerae TaxID=322095 RepID=A0A134AZ44_9PORP|nr:hypothetical protein HMPREF3184_02150 [Porphyromonadaceae bacterium KA00676]KXB72957.1 hypothetical protein HMPREF3185_02150 [Porphyromonas somerae]
MRELKLSSLSLRIEQSRSHPSRVRELKPPNGHATRTPRESHPSRVRELKRTKQKIQSSLARVAPLPGA